MSTTTTASTIVVAANRFIMFGFSEIVILSWKERTGKSRECASIFFVGTLTTQLLQFPQSCVVNKALKINDRDQAERSCKTIFTFIYTISHNHRPDCLRHQWKMRKLVSCYEIISTIEPVRHRSQYLHHVDLPCWKKGILFEKTSVAGYLIVVTVE